MKSNYEEKKAARIESYKRLSDKNEKASEQQFKRASEMASVIPFGQPILIGHHSEGRDRNYRKKIRKLQDKAMESSSKAKYYEHKAESAELNDAISSDDPNAIKKLKENLKGMEESQELMKAANKVIRNNKTKEDEKVMKLIELGLKEQDAQAILRPNVMGHIGFARYSFQNNYQNMARVRERIKYLEKLEQVESREIVINGIKILTNTEDNRIQIYFPGKPDEATRKTLKSHGFRWAPSVGAWQRQISRAAEYWANQIVSDTSKKMIS